jgi:prepilin-type N-terminal cleavage/methylation domain-containing protein
MKKENGFTLVEMIIALGVAAIMMTAIYAAINTAQVSTSKIERRVTTQQDARSAMEIMAMEIGMASYNPTLNNTMWTPNQDYLGIQVAGANSITVEMDIDESSTIGNVENEIITYNYDSTNKYITRSTNNGTAQPFIGSSNTDTKTVRVMNVDPEGPTLPVFKYYDGEGIEITAPVTANIRNIRRVDITLAVDPAVSDPGGRRQKLIYSTSVIPRNHIIFPYLQ